MSNNFHLRIGASKTYQLCYAEKSEIQLRVAEEFPLITGLGSGNTVFITTSPAHVVRVCQMSVAVPFDDVKHYFKPESIVHEWMK